MAVGRPKMAKSKWTKSPGIWKSHDPLSKSTLTEPGLVSWASTIFHILRNKEQKRKTGSPLGNSEHQKPRHIMEMCLEVFIVSFLLIKSSSSRDTYYEIKSKGKTEMLSPESNQTCGRQPLAGFALTQVLIPYITHIIRELAFGITKSENQLHRIQTTGLRGATQRTFQYIQRTSMMLFCRDIRKHLELLNVHYFIFSSRLLLRRNIFEDQLVSSSANSPTSYD